MKDCQSHQLCSCSSVRWKVGSVVKEWTSLYVKQMMEGFVNKHWCKNKQSFSGRFNNSGIALTREEVLASVLKENSEGPSSHTAPWSQRGGGTPREAQPSQGKLSHCICNKQLFRALQCWTPALQHCQRQRNGVWGGRNINLNNAKSIIKTKIMHQQPPEVISNSLIFKQITLTLYELGENCKL